MPISVTAISGSIAPRRVINNRLIEVFSSDN
jgi:hypothetical protein